MGKVPAIEEKVRQAPSTRPKSPCCWKCLQRGRAGRAVQWQVGPGHPGNVYTDVCSASSASSQAFRGAEGSLQARRVHMRPFRFRAAGCICPS